MNLKILEKSDRYLKLVAEDIDFALANAIRRVASSEVPVLAIEHVDFTENLSGLFDEVVAHRLGLIPLIFPEKLNLRKECTCRGRGCSNCQVSFSLEKQGPCIVRAGDMVSSNEDARPLDPDIPIVELLEDQRIALEAIAELNIGKEHAKWQAAVIGYRNVPIVRLNPEKGDVNPAYKVCPQNVFEKKDGGIRIARSINCDLCMRCVEVCEPGSVYIGEEENSFIFSIESISGLTAAQVLSKSLEIISDRSDEFIKEVRKEVK